MDRKAQTDNMLDDVVRKEFTQSMAKNDAETRLDHLCTRSMETRTNEVMHVTTYVLVTCFIHTRQAGHKYALCTCVGSSSLVAVCAM